MKRQKNIFFKRTYLILILSISFNSYSQDPITECQEDFHGVGYVDKECDEPIIITSTSNEGSDGTIFYGQIYSKYGSVKFIPGYSKIRLVPYPNSNENRVGDRTKTGTGGKPVGGRNADPNLSDLNPFNATLKIYPNPFKSSLTITSTLSDIVSYEVYSIDGRILIKEDLKKSSNHIINLEHLKQGMHLLKLYQKNGVVITKHIIKQ